MFQVKINSALDITLGDNPVFQGRIFLNGDIQGSTEIAFVTIRAKRANDVVLFTEKLVLSLDTNKFSFIHEFLNPFNVELNAGMLIAIFPMEIFPLPTTTTGTGPAATTINLLFDPTSPIQTVPPSGWIRLNDEVITFTRISATSMNIVAREVFGTSIATHSIGSLARISETKNTFPEVFKINILDDIARVKDKISELI